MRLSEKELTIIRNFLQAQPVSKAYLFGSQARGDAGPGSDVDLILHLDEGVGMVFFGIKPSLESLLQKKVDVLTEGSVSNKMKPFIEADKILIYERAAI